MHQLLRFHRKVPCLIVKCVLLDETILFAALLKGLARCDPFFCSCWISIKRKVQIACQYIILCIALDVPCLLPCPLKSICPGEILSAGKGGEMKLMPLQEIPLICDNALSKSLASHIAHTLKFLMHLANSGNTPSTAALRWPIRRFRTRSSFAWRVPWRRS